MAEDTRHTAKLLAHYAINTTLLPLHAHNEGRVADHIVKRLVAGECGALVSDAGTPLVSDPGSMLTASCHGSGVKVVPVPGPCALVAALSAAGFSAKSFVFLGFLPSKSGARKAALLAVKQEMRTVVCYEAPHRLLAFLEDVLAVLGEDR